MSSSEISPENVSTLISQVLKAKDPATVGLKRILRKKEEERNDYPLRTITLEEFTVTGNNPKKLNENERHVLELEKKVADLQIELKKQRQTAIAAVQAAYTKGKQEGIALGRDEGTSSTTDCYEKKIDVLQQRMGDIIEHLESSKQKVFSNAEHLVLQLCCAMVKKVIDHEVSIHRDIVLAVLKRALTYIGHREKMVVRVAPDDLETISERKDFWFPVADRLADITIEADARIERGGCIIESNSGLVDARLGVQFDELAGLIEKTWNEVTSAAGNRPPAASVDKQNPPAAAAQPDNG
jgi:flagellar biosynthesis/type III secretory pathway protein FliH